MPTTLLRTWSVSDPQGHLMHSTPAITRVSTAGVSSATLGAMRMHATTRVDTIRVDTTTAREKVIRCPR